MSFNELIRKRYSARSYSDRKVFGTTLDEILEAARVAPTGANKQPFKLIVVESKEGLEKVAKGANIFGAPLAIIVCGNKDEVWVRGYDQKNLIDIDASIVTTHMMLQATELGVDSVWVCNFDPKVIIEEFDIADNLVPVNILVLGYSKKEPASPDRFDVKRKPIEDLVIYK